MIKYHSLLPLYQKFIIASKKGKRLKKNGSRLKSETIKNYLYTLKNLTKFSFEKKVELKIPELRGNNKREFKSVKLYWQKFYKKFTEFLCKNLDHYDNYVGLTIKNIRVFFNWLRQEQGVNIGEFYKSFYVRKEDIPIITLSKEQLQFLIYDKALEQQLCPKLRQSKDLFVFGCIVGLRFSDLVALTRHNLNKRDGEIYLFTQSLKTGNNSSIKLPPYLLEIIKRYKRRKTLLPSISLSHFNCNIKKICKIAGWNYSVIRVRKQSGKLKSTKPITLPFYKLVSSHIMRRTAITTMLTLGMPELLVKKISGHADNSRAFYRYVDLAQQYMDKEIDRAYEKLFDRAYKM